MKRHKFYKVAGILGIIAIVVGMVFTNLSCKKEPEVYKIGAILPLTGGAAYLGETVRNAVLLAQEKINGTGSINGKKLEIICEDSKMDPREGVSIANKFIDMDKIKVIQTWGTSISMAVQPIANENRVVQMVVSIHPTIVDKSDYTFRVFYNVLQATELFEEYLKHERPSRIGLLYQNGEAWISQIEHLEPKLKELGIESVYKESFEEGEKNFKSFATKILSARPEVLIVLGYGSHFPSLFKALKEFEVIGKVKILGGLDFLELPKDAPKELFEDVVFVLPAVNIITPSKKTEEFRKGYERKYGKIPDHQAAYAYDTIILLAKAMEQVGYDSGKIKDYLLKVKGYEGVSGTIDILPNGDTRTSLSFATYRNQEVIPFTFEER